MREAVQGVRRRNSEARESVFAATAVVSRVAAKTDEVLRLGATAADGYRNGSGIAVGGALSSDPADQPFLCYGSEATTVNRIEFQILADVRLAEAKTLLDNCQWDGAYYLAGYAVECGLKACIAKLTKEHDFPPKPRVVQDYYTHNLATLLVQAQLEGSWDTDSAADPALKLNGATVNLWTEMSRYERKTEIAARALYEAISELTHGVLPWIKRYW
jgi:hypothetical protein